LWIYGITGNLINCKCQYLMVTIMEKNLILLAVVFVSVLLLISCKKDRKDSDVITSPEEKQQIIKNISVAQCDSLIKAESGGKNFFIIDVRTPSEYAGGHLNNALNIDYNSAAFRDSIKALDRGDTYLIYCQSGNRSGNALAVMAEEGFKEVYNMTGGFGAWKSKGYPFER
jgi:rhodanese-related sulfurtransferase